MRTAAILACLTSPSYAPKLVPPLVDSALSSAGLLHAAWQLAAVGAVGVALHVEMSAIGTALEHMFPTPKP
jgi:hypothetical protein